MTACAAAARAPADEGSSCLMFLRGNASSSIYRVGQRRRIGATLGSMHDLTPIDRSVFLRTALDDVSLGRAALRTLTTSQRVPAPMRHVRRSRNLLREVIEMQVSTEGPSVVLEGELAPHLSR